MKLDRAKGTRDFAPPEQLLRNSIIATIRSVFEKYGFLPFETPLIERYDVMTAKFAAGEEADSTKEIFKLTDQGKRKLGLRYEFTFPLARYLAMNPKLRMPFKRYQIGPIFRDGPIKLGRYREFYQCDVDTVGVKSLLAEAEILAAVSEIFTELGIGFELMVSSRKFLFELLAKAKIPKSKQATAVICIDKLEKIGVKGVTKEMQEKGIDTKSCKEILNWLEKAGTNKSKIAFFEGELGDSPAIQELKELFNWLDQLNVSYAFTPSLARGLGYYTGPIFEAIAKKSDVNVSIAGGGRWDDMIGKYMGSKEMIPATGFSIGLEPVFEILKKQKQMGTSVQLYIVPMGTEKECLPIVQKFRSAGIATIMDMRKKNLRKNLDYAAKEGIPFVGIIGEDELAAKKIMFRDMKKSSQDLKTVKEIVKLLN